MTRARAGSRKPGPFPEALPVTEPAVRSAIEPVSMTRYGPDFEGFARDLGRSFERYGFAVVGDHGLDQSMLDEALAQTKAFFALPEETKRA